MSALDPDFKHTCWRLDEGRRDAIERVFAGEPSTREERDEDAEAEEARDRERLS